MRYGQRGGYTPAGQRRRERLRLEAAGRQADLAAGTVGAVAMIDSIGIGADVARRDELLRQLWDVTVMLYVNWVGAPAASVRSTRMTCLPWRSGTSAFQPQ